MLFQPEKNIRRKKIAVDRKINIQAISWQLLLIALRVYIQSIGVDITG